MPYIPQNTPQREDIAASVARLRKIANDFEDTKASGGGQHIFDKCAPLMAGIHLALIQALFQQYKLALLQSQHGNFEGPKMKAWVEYCSMGEKAIHHHHDREEAQFFPGMVKLAPAFEEDMKKNIDEHHAFHTSLTHLSTFLTPLLTLPTPSSTKPSLLPLPYDPLRHLEILDEIIPALVPHLEGEVETLGRANLERRGFEEGSFGVLMAETERDAKADDPHATLPFFFGHSETNWIGIPAPVGWCMKLVFARKHAAAWQFCPFSPFAFGKIEYPSDVPFHVGKSA